ncbi:hypothetical protein ONR57_03105 [Hoyosella sp. YIM 151337]|uniref:hypothetical protein n=1 Tax=Hoyosella sp. YIM 151337 TaxID=2992742 RepID=UPI00223617D6|nr:hypothetical protein [Hoyosella sp. YIM 151337]MCW4352283.1 hypothetical protein [Hoyosella sp. YIM 151337]
MAATSPSDEFRKPSGSRALYVPLGIRAAGAIVSLQGIVLLGLAVWLTARAITKTGGTEVSGFATAGWFLFLGIPVLAAGAALIIGKRWGRSIAVVLQLLLLPVVFSMFTGSHQYVWGFVLGGVVVGTLVLLMTGRSSEWMSEE